MSDFLLEKYQNAFVDALREIIGEKSILAFSKEIGIPERTINSWINKLHKPTMEYLIRLSLYSGYSIDYLVGLES